jgi:hypothetical protein
MGGMTLYELEDDLAALVETQEAGGVPVELEAEIQLRVQEALTGAVEKRDRMAQFLAHLEGQQELAQAEIRRLQERKRVMGATQERLERYVIAVMERLGVKKLEGQVSTLSLRACPVSVVIEDERCVPEAYAEYVTERRVSKLRIKLALEGGEEVTGARLVTDKKTLVRR